MNGLDDRLKCLVSWETVARIPVLQRRLLRHVFEPLSWQFENLDTELQDIVGDQATLDLLKAMVFDKRK